MLLREEHTGKNMIPTIFIHNGYQPYLNYTINQSCKYNKTILIGTHNLINNNNLKFAPITDYSKYLQSFIEIYEHKSTNDYNYELFCFLRWFILKEYMEINQLKTIFYVDSDVMTYVNPELEYDKYCQYDFTLLHRCAAISSFFTKNGLDNFCNFLMETFKNKNSYDYVKIKSHFEVRQKFKLPGGVCDMTYFDYFHNLDNGGGPGKIGEMMSIIDDSTYDHNINCEDQYFDFENGMKKIKIKDNKPYVYNHKLKKYIKFNCLHFQGSSKGLISNYYI